MAPHASVIVNTHNRAASLRRTIASILSCTGGDGLYEVIVVDNASTDDTPEVVRDLIREHRGRGLRYLREERLGVHYARHAGATAARAPLLVYADDDVLVEPEWAKAYVDAFGDHPEMAAAGGPVLPHWETAPPLWLAEMVASELSTRRMCGELSLIDLSPSFTPDGGTFFGVNMAVRRDALRRYGGFQPDLFGNRLLGAGEWGLYWVMRRAGAAVGYVPQALLRHSIPAARMQPEYFERWARMESAAKMFQRWRGQPRTPRTLLVDARRILISYWRSWVRALWTRRRPDARIVRARSRAQGGLAELTYLWWIVSRRDLRGFLDARTYWP